MRHVRTLSPTSKTGNANHIRAVRAIYAAWLSFCGALLLTASLSASAQEAASVEGKAIRQIQLLSEGPLSRIATPDLISLIGFKKGGPYSSAEAKHAIQRLHSTELFHDVLIDVRPVGADSVDVDVILVRRFYIKEISFDGDLKLEPSDLRRDLAFRAGEAFYPELMEETVARLREMYQKQGFYQARIEPRFEVDYPTAELKIEFRIQAGTRAVVSVIQFDVEGGIDPTSLQSLISTRAGQPYSQLQMDQDIAVLERYFVRQGYLNPDIYLRGGAAYDAAGNSVSLVVRVVPRERSQLTFEGIDPNSKELEGLSLFSERGSALALLEESVEALETRVQRDGYFLAGVSYETSGTEENRRIVIRVNRGNRYRIAKALFEGNSTIPEERLKRILRIKEAGVLSRGEFTDRLAREDAERIASFYQQRGFMDVKVDREIRADYPEAGRLTVVFKIQEGPPYVLEDLQIVGNHQIDETALRREIQVKEGEPFSPVGIAQDRGNILAAYENQGYRGTDIQYEITYPQPGRARVRFVIEEGEKWYVDQVVLAGLVDTRPSAVKKEVVVHAGQPLSLERVLTTETNLHDLAVFSRVDVKQAPAFGDPNLRNVIIRVEEAKKYSLLYGIGYSSFEGVRGTFGVSNSNFMGRAHTLSLGLRAGRQRQRANVSYSLPRVFDWQLPTVLTAAIDNEKALTEQLETRRALRGRPFDAYRLIGSGQSERRLSARESFFIRANFQNIKIDVPPNLATPLQFFREEENLRLSSVAISYLNESRDDPLSPKFGFFLSGEALLSTKLIGSERQFFRILTQAQYYKQVFPNVVLATSLRLGMILPFANSLPADIENPVPISERFFSGGSTTLRGLTQDLAGPLLRDPATGEIVLVDEFGRPDPEGRPVPLGGNGLAIGNVELRFPLFWFLSGAVFYDIGNVFRSITDVSQAGWSNAIGFGVRANTPVGPVRFDIGYNPKPPPTIGFSHWNFHFTLGHPF
ncbi:MAG: outer membrane protein assembly factor [Acidobacteria bacterium]|nr:MAG: outer membrane protein assembly factor [Acidobacteriota bacterium]